MCSAKGLPRRAAGHGYHKTAVNEPKDMDDEPHQAMDAWMEDEPEAMEDEPQEIDDDDDEPK